MRKLATIIVLCLLVAGNAHAGSLQDRLAGLLGIEPEPVSRSALSMDAAPSRTLAVDAAPSRVASNFTAWLLGTPTEMDNPDAEISLRAGWLNDDLEIGVQFDAIGVHGENDEAFGVYVIMHIDADGVLGTTYFGYAAGIQNIRSYGPLVGTILDGIAIEYRYRDFSPDSPLGNATDRHQVYVGLPLRF
jgi:hypothetical protein